MAETKPNASEVVFACERCGRAKDASEKLIPMQGPDRSTHLCSRCFALHMMSDGGRVDLSREKPRD